MIRCLAENNQLLGEWLATKTQTFPYTKYCYKASSYSPSKNADPALAVFAMNFEGYNGQIKVFKVTSTDTGNVNDPHTVEEAQTIYCYKCSDQDVGSYDGEIFIAVASMYFQTIQVEWVNGQWGYIQLSLEVFVYVSPFVVKLSFPLALDLSPT